MLLSSARGVGGSCFYYYAGLKFMMRGLCGEQKNEFHFLFTKKNRFGRGRRNACKSDDSGWDVLQI